MVTRLAAKQILVTNTLAEHAAKDLARLAVRTRASCVTPWYALGAAFSGNYWTSIAQN
jgi:hypothetical protein